MKRVFDRTGRAVKVSPLYTARKVQGRSGLLGASKGPVKEVDILAPATSNFMVPSLLEH